MNENECNIKSAKHASVGFNDHFIYFITKAKCKNGNTEIETKSAIFRLDTRDLIVKLN